MIGRLLISALAALLLPFEAHAQQPAPIIDVHLHAYPIGTLGPPGVPNPVTGQPSPQSDAAMREAILDAMERYNIVEAVVSGCPFSLPLEWKAASERFIPAPYLGGSRGCWPDPDSLRAAHATGDLGAIGELGLQYAGLAPDSPEVAPYLALAEELNLPVSFHMGVSFPNTPFTCCPEFRLGLGRPHRLEQILLAHPDLRINMMHAGYPYLDETIALMFVYPNVYVDVGAISWIHPQEEFHRYLDALVRAGFGDRILFGSDQMAWPDAIGLAVEAIEAADFLTEEQKRDIFYRNAARFLELSEEEIARHHER